MKMDRTSEIVTGISVMSISSLGIFWLIPAQTSLAASGNYDVPPSLIPQITGILCLALGGGLTLRAWRMPATETPSAPAASEGSGAGERSAQDKENGEDKSAANALSGKGLFFDLAVWAGSSIPMMLVLPIIGFIAAGTMLLAAWMVFAGARSILLIAGVSFALPVFLDRLCWYALTVQLP